jgi:transcription initiation factor TFIIIB Brf1 subunit/transcription initiation factor TFIIB
MADLVNVINIFDEINKPSITTIDIRDIIDYCDFCKSCQSHTHIKYDTINGSIVCTLCGIQLSYIFDYSLYNKSFDKPYNCKSDTIFTYNYSMSYNQKKIYNAYNIIQYYCKKANLSSTIEYAANDIYKSIYTSDNSQSKNKIIKGRNITYILAACVYYASNNKNSPRTIQEIAYIFSITKSNVTKGCNLLSKLMRNIGMKQQCAFSSDITDSYIIRHCNNLRISKQISDDIISMLSNVHKLGIVTNNTPISLCASVIYIVLQMHNIQLPKKILAVEFGISDVTITKTYGKLMPFKSILSDVHKTNDVHKYIMCRRNNEIPPHIQHKLYVVNNTYGDLLRRREYDELSVHTMLINMLSCVANIKIHNSYILLSDCKFKKYMLCN